MRLKIVVTLGFLLLSLVFSLGVPSQATVSAETLLQDVPSLTGKNIYFSELSGEAGRFDRSDQGLSRLAGLLRNLGANLYNLDWRSRFPEDADLIVVAGPVTDFTPDQIARLWSYVTNGGQLLLLANPVGDAATRALPANSGLFELFWNDMGIRGRADVVASEETGQEEATEEPGEAVQDGLTVNFTTSNLNDNHPITANLDEELAFFVARSIEYDASLRDVETTPLVFSDNSFYGEVAYAAYLESGTFEYNVGADTSRGPLALAVAFENPATGTRIVMIGDREFVTNGAGFRTSPPGSASFLYPANVRFAINAITWLLDKDEVDLSLPTPGPTATSTLIPTPTLAPTATPST
jgi:hypothetical protein